jgi:hypothetical protein
MHRGVEIHAREWARKKPKWRNLFSPAVNQAKLKCLMIRAGRLPAFHVSPPIDDPICHEFARN